jgi:hypothetical protein
VATRDRERHLRVDPSTQGPEPNAPAGLGGDVGGDQVGLLRRLSGRRLKGEADHPLRLLPGQADVGTGDQPAGGRGERRERLGELGQ